MSNDHVLAYRAALETFLDTMVEICHDIPKPEAEFFHLCEIPFFEHEEPA